MQNDDHRFNRRQVLAGMNAALVAAGTGVTLKALGAGSAAGVAPPGAAPAAGMGPYAVREIENTWIVMPDGVKLAARIWLPQGAGTKRVPAILNYCPYFGGVQPFVNAHARATAGRDVDHPIGVVLDNR